MIDMCAIIRNMLYTGTSRTSEKDIESQNNLGFRFYAVISYF